MKKLTLYQAVDGKTFPTEKECRAYNFLCELVDRAMLPLGKADGNSNFINGGGYYQHDMNIVVGIKKKILELAEARYGAIIGWGFVGRYMDDSNDRCLYHAWGRLSSIDEKGREWGQIYYANNPLAASPVLLHRNL